MTRATHSRQSGMTLIELLVSMVIMGVLSAMILGSWFALSKAYSFTSRTNKQRDVANLAIARTLVDGPVSYTHLTLPTIYSV